MATKLDRIITVPGDAREAVAQFSRFLEGVDQAQVVEAGGTGVDLPPEVLAVLRDVVDAMATGNAVTVQAFAQQLTTQAAADLLGVSRPTLVRLLEEGQIPFTRPGRHRRVRLLDLLAYRERIRTARRAFLDEMTRESAYYESESGPNDLAVDTR